MVPLCPDKTFAGRLIASILASGCLLLGTFVATGCGSVDALPAKTVPAQLVVQNDTGYAWRLTITNPPRSDSIEEEVAPHATRTIAIAGGEHEIRQNVTDANTPTALTRTFSFRTEAGQIYHWRLVTLLSGDTAP